MREGVAALEAAGLLPAQPALTLPGCSLMKRISHTDTNTGRHTTSGCGMVGFAALACDHLLSNSAVCMLSTT